MFGFLILRKLHHIHDDMYKPEVEETDLEFLITGFAVAIVALVFVVYGIVQFLEWIF